MKEKLSGSFLGVKQAKGVQPGNFIGKGGGDGSISMTQQVRKNVTKVVYFFVFVSKVIGKGKTAARLG